MSVRINIEPSGIFKKSPDMSALIKKGCGYGVWDEAFRLNQDELGEKVLIYDKEKLARGITLERADHFVSLYLSEPTSGDEIYDFYEYVKFVCKLMSVKTFVQNAVKKKLDDIPMLFKEQKEVSEQKLLEIQKDLTAGKVPCYYIFGCLHPIAIGLDDIEEVGGDLDKFGDFLNKKQKGNFYYSAPLVKFARPFTKKELKDRRNKKRGEDVPAPEVEVTYEVIPDADVIFPLVNRLFVKEKVKVESTGVMLKMTKTFFKTVNYAEFLKNIDSGRMYDAEHCIIHLSKEKMEAIADKLGA